MVLLLLSASASAQAVVHPAGTTDPAQFSPNNAVTHVASGPPTILGLSPILTNPATPGVSIMANTPLYGGDDALRLEFRSFNLAAWSQAQGFAPGTFSPLHGITDIFLMAWPAYVPTAPITVLGLEGWHGFMPFAQLVFVPGNWVADSVAVQTSGDLVYPPGTLSVLAGHSVTFQMLWVVPGAFPSPGGAAALFTIPVTVAF